ncbi:MAG TPA: DNA repair exonuclease, partial [Gemmatirosa sp.]
MRLVHLADLHLGFRQYQRLTPTGVNQREADVARTFARAIDRTIALAPDLVVIAGDVFHVVRPPNPAILHAFRQFMRLQVALPNTVVVMVAGNHDAPRTAETGSILKLFTECGVRVIDGAAERIALPEFDASVLAVPDVPGHVRPVLAPDPSARYNVLLLHGEVEGMLRGVASAERAAVEIPRADLRAPEWDYIALGHYHVYREVEPNAFYAGSIDYTSFDAWGERRDERDLGIPGKGIVERDLATERHVFHPLEASRALVDLAPVEGAGLGARELDAAVRAAVDGVPGGIEEKIVRLRAVDVPRHVAREMDHKALREYKRRALHFQFETVRPEVARIAAGGSPGRRPSLADVVREKLATRLLPGEVPRDAFVSLGLKYLAE